MENEKCQLTNDKSVFFHVDAIQPSQTEVCATYMGFLGRLTGSIRSLALAVLR